MAGDRDEGEQETGGGGEDEGDEGAVAARGDDHQDHGGDQDGGAGEQELEPPDSFSRAEGQQS